jgi:hypothetical protein
VLSCGDTFLIPKRSDQIEHLWIVITEPDGDGKAICVNVTTKQEYSDTTLILRRGDHPFIRHDSVAHYPDAKILDLNKVEAALATGGLSFVCEAHAPCEESVVRKIQEGLLKSPHPSKGLKAYYRERAAAASRR